MRRRTYSVVTGVLLTSLLLTSCRFAPPKASPNPRVLQIATFIEKHQPELSGKAERRRFMRRATTLATQLPPHAPTSLLWAETNKLARTLHDPHTMVDPPQNRGASLPLLFQWVNGGVVVFATTGRMAAINRSRVLQIGSLTPSAVIRHLQALYAGNMDFLKTIATPDLSSSVVLNWLGVIHRGRVRLVLQTVSGHITRVTVPLVAATPAEDAAALSHVALTVEDKTEAPPGIKFSAVRYYTWAINPKHNYAVFWLGQCRDTAGYRRAVAMFFRSVRVHHITNIVWDLQNNSGGNSMVIGPWLDRIRGPVALNGYNGSLMIPTRVAPRDQFGGHLYVLVNGGTFSSGVMVAEILVANHLATLIGQSPGMGPSGYGNVAIEQAAGLQVQTSTTVFSAPGNSWRSYLLPNVLIPLTVQDLQSGINPVAQWLNAHL